jgi:hypothetical protein
VRECIDEIRGPMETSALKYSPPVLLIALGYHMGALVDAHRSSGLLTQEDLEEVISDACQFGMSAKQVRRPRSAQTKRVTNQRPVRHRITPSDGAPVFARPLRTPRGDSGRAPEARDRGVRRRGVRHR